MGTILLKTDKKATYPHNSQIVLASGSQARKNILKREGILFESSRPTCDEELLKAEHKDKKASELCLILAKAKARSLQNKYPNQIILASDQTLECRGNSLNKPENLEDVRQTLQTLSGQRHFLYTAAVLLYKGDFIYEEVSQNILKMKELTSEEMENYLLSKGQDVIGCLGAYQIEDTTYHFIDVEEGEQSAIEGLPILNLKCFLKEE